MSSSWTLSLEIDSDSLLEDDKQDVKLSDTRKKVCAAIKDILPASSFVVAAPLGNDSFLHLAVSSISRYECKELTCLLLSGFAWKDINAGGGSGLGEKVQLKTGGCAVRLRSLHLTTNR